MNVKKDLSYAFSLSRICLRLFGVWPDPDGSLNIFRPNIRFMIVTCILSFYVIVPQLSNTFHAWGNVDRMVAHIASANFSIMALCKLFATWYHGKKLQTLMASVMTDWINSTNDRERNTMLRLAKRGRSLSSRCYILVIITLLFYTCFNLVKFYQNIHLSQRSLVYSFVYPYNSQESPSYEITFAIQLSGGICTGLINCTVDTFVSIFLLHICAQLINLRMTLNNLVDELANKLISIPKFKEGIGAVAVRHNHLIRNAKTIDNCYSLVLLVHMLAATFQLCFQTFQVYTIITDKLDVSAFKTAFLTFYIACVLSQLYIYCYSAERLITESTNMAYSVYKCKWYSIPAKDVKNLIFIGYGSLIPLNLTAGGFGIFSMKMFGATVKTAMGYLSMLMTMKEN
ncbi:odorant receptor 13a-like [Anoplolepis gracilipes]|uniref:odorant receptor 13a-like n=1 Tax=Anoplolepis gracilipes TaxID=354296 RepID=UPI003B9ED8EB